MGPTAATTMRWTAEIRDRMALGPLLLSELLESVMAEARKARAVGFNHVALEVDDIE